MRRSPSGSPGCSLTTPITHRYVPPGNALQKGFPCSCAAAPDGCELRAPCDPHMQAIRRRIMPDAYIRATNRDALVWHVGQVGRSGADMRLPQVCVPLRERNRSRIHVFPTDHTVIDGGS